MSRPEDKPGLADSATDSTKITNLARPHDHGAKTQTHLAWLRTRMSMESALSGWVRTATSLIGFGFAIVQFLVQFNHSSTGPHMGRYVGLILIAVGTLTTGLAIWAYRKILKYLEGDTFEEIAVIPGLHRKFPDPALLVALLVFFIGVFAFFVIVAGTGSPIPEKS